MTAGVETPKSNAPSELDAAVGRVREGAEPWARMGLPERIAIARRMQQGYLRVAERSVQAACAAKGIAPGAPLEGEEWLSGPYPTVRLLRLIIESLTALSRTGNTPIGRVGRTIDGRLRVRCYPASLPDAIVFQGLTTEVHLEAGVTEDELHRTRARFYKQSDHRGRVALVLGAGNVSCIPPMDVLSKLFNEGKVCVLKMSPVNAYLGPFLEEAFREPVDRGFLAIVHGGADEGAHLCRHPGVDEIHITGSARTHDAIVWGPPGPERTERMARHQPLLEKEITGELGNISPVLVVPGPYTDREMDFQAEQIVGAVTTNCSFLCNAAKMLVMPRGWERGAKLLARIEQKLAAAPVRRAYYPGAEQRYRALTEGRSRVKRIGSGEGALPWTLLTGLDPDDGDEPAFRTEPFCSILSAVEVGSSRPEEFLGTAVAWANQRLWGTLCAGLVVHPRTMRDPGVAEAVERAIVDLRYGAVALNIWPAYAFALGTTPWGAHPGSTLADIQSGRGWVHNTSMIERIEKSVVRHPLTASPKPPYFPSHRTSHVVGRRATFFEERQSWLRLPGLVAAGLRG
jgi:aldehyde dehydrogenase (NAD(P)+)